MKSGYLDKLIDRLDKVDPEAVQRIVLKAVQEKGFLEKVFDVLREGIIVTGVRGSIHYINHAACEFFGLNRNDTIGQEISRYFPEIDWDDMVGSGRVVNRELEVLYPEHRYLSCYIAPIEEIEAKSTDDSELGGYVLILRDTTQNRQLHQEEIESERLNALTMLAAGVAHEIGNPLNSLGIHLQLLDRKIKKKASPELAAELLEPLDIARSEIKRLDFIVEKFLSAVRPTKPIFESADLNEIVEEAVSFIAPEVEDRRITTTLSLQPELPLLNLDRDQMKQVIYNLIRNAGQAIGSDGKLTIRTFADDFNVSIAFADNGSGIPAEKVGKVFDPYFTTKKTGSGLGLLIVHRIIREHGGELEFESEEGEGTEVTIHFPRIEKRMRFLPQKAQAEVIDVDADAVPTK